MKGATAIALCAIIIILATLTLFHLTTDYLNTIKEEPLSMRTVFATVFYAFAFIMIIFITLLLTALALALAE